MKTLTIRQPHVELILAGLKIYETRSWRTTYRGPLLIHAGAALDKSAMIRFVNIVPAALARGQILGLVELVDCVPAEVVTDARFGDFSPGRWAWLLAHPMRLRDPIAARGRLGFWQSDIIV